MAIFRRKNSADTATSDASTPEAAEATDEVVEPAAAPDLRADGPWDASEKSTEGDSAYFDFGSLKVRGRVGFDIRLQADEGSDVVAALLLVAEDAAVELRAFASSRSGGLWEDVRGDLIDEIDRLEGSYEVVDGQYGPELHLRIPMTLDDGAEGFQPSRIVVVEGPRWMLRATFLGRAALEPTDEGVLFQALKDVVVVRGDHAMASRDPLVLQIPQGLDPVQVVDD